MATLELKVDASDLEKRLNPDNLETRAFKSSVEVRSAGDDGQIVIEGVAVPYGDLSHDLGGFREMFEPGAFGDDVASEDVTASAIEHDSRTTIGRTPETLELLDSERELRYRITPPDLQDARDTAERIRSGILNGSSFTFSVLPDGQEFDERSDGTLIRRITRAKLYEVSPVTNPAYPTTDASVAQRSLNAWQEERGQKALEEVTATPPPVDRDRQARMAQALQEREFGRR